MTDYLADKDNFLSSDEQAQFGGKVADGVMQYNAMLGAVNNSNLKARNWSAVTANVAIPQANLAGIVVTVGGSLVLIGSDGTSELDLGTVTADPLTILPFCPTKIKTGSTATIKAVYGA